MKTFFFFYINLGDVYEELEGWEVGYDTTRCRHVNETFNSEMFSS